jgi:uncharacterized ferritin-like protein (DUF455 family)
MSDTLFAAARACLAEGDTDRKIACVRRLREAWVLGKLVLDTAAPPDAISVPGRPARPILVPAFEVRRGSPRTREGRAALIHALAHIEFNAINLALDAAHRFRELPRDYYDNWLRVAHEEAHHFELLRDHLRALGFDYGDFPAHDGLWEMAMKTAHDPLARMALVPKTLEARGLDANPALAEKFRAAGDERAAEILGIILRDEIGHVAIGNRWFEYLCAQRGLDPLATFQRLIEEHRAPRPRALNAAARRAAGFSDAELGMLEAKSSGEV